MPQWIAGLLILFAAVSAYAIGYKDGKLAEREKQAFEGLGRIIRKVRKE